VPPEFEKYFDDKYLKGKKKPFPEWYSATIAQHLVLLMRSWDHGKKRL
jgi:hypothetical protein